MSSTSFLLFLVRNYNSHYGDVKQTCFSIPVFVSFTAFSQFFYNIADSQVLYAFIKRLLHIIKDNKKGALKEQFSGSQFQFQQSLALHILYVSLKTPDSDHQLISFD